MKNKPPKPIRFDPLIYDDHGIVSGRILFNIISCLLLLIVSMILIIISRSTICNTIDTDCIFSTHNHPNSMLSHNESTQSTSRLTSQPQLMRPISPFVTTAPVIAAPVIAGSVIAAQIVTVPGRIAPVRVAPVKVAPVRIVPGTASSGQITDQQPISVIPEVRHKTLKDPISAQQEKHAARKGAAMTYAATTHTHPANDAKTALIKGSRASLWISTMADSKTRLQSISFDSYEHCLAALHSSAGMAGQTAHCSLDR